MFGYILTEFCCKIFTGNERLQNATEYVRSGNAFKNICIKFVKKTLDINCVFLYLEADLARAHEGVKGWRDRMASLYKTAV